MKTKEARQQWDGVVAETVQACRDCEEIALALSNASLPALAKLEVWDAVKRCEERIKQGAAYQMDETTIDEINAALFKSEEWKEGEVWRFKQRDALSIAHRIMHGRKGGGDDTGGLPLEQIGWLERLALGIPGEVEKPRNKRLRTSRDFGGERQAYFATVDYFFRGTIRMHDGKLYGIGNCGHVKDVAFGVADDAGGWRLWTEHLGRSFEFLGQSLAAIAGTVWPDKASPLAVRVADALTIDKGSQVGDEIRELKQTTERIGDAVDDVLATAERTEGKVDGFGATFKKLPGALLALLTPKKNYPQEMLEEGAEMYASHPNYGDKQTIDWKPLLEKYHYDPKAKNAEDNFVRALQRHIKKRH